MTKARTLADFISDGSPLADGTISVSEVSGAAPIESPTFTGAVNLDAISATIADTAVDIFVYDTSKDSDGGAWRKRTQGTSWYNETLNTATRGSRKEFPSVAVIVAESNQVTIYDGDDPSLPMWMVFNARNTLLYPDDITSVVMQNGLLASGGDDAVYYGFVEVNFISESAILRTASTSYGSTTNISGRNSTFPYSTLGSTGTIANVFINDVAMTVLPNAPIDAATGLPVPTIAVATGLGTSIIRDDGTVVDYTLGNYTIPTVDFDYDNNIVQSSRNIGSGGGGLYVNKYPILSADNNSGTIQQELVISSSAGDNTSGLDFIRTPFVEGTKNVVGMKDSTLAFSSDAGAVQGIGVYQLGPDGTTKTTTLGAVISSDYNTGWMNGDIKLATLSDTDDTNVTGSELVTNGTFDTDFSGWTVVAGASYLSISGGIAVSDTTSGSGGVTPTIEQVITTEVGKTYTISVTGLRWTSGNWTMITLDGSSIIQDNNGSTDVGNYYDASDSGHYTFTASKTSYTLGWRSRADNTRAELNNISVRLAEEDRSVNGNGLQVFGTVAKTPVATGADLVAYSGWSGSRYLQQPYNSDLDFTDTMFVSVWVKDVTSALNVFDRGARYTDHSYGLYLRDAQDDIRFYYSSNGTTDNLIEVSGGGALLNSGWHHIAVSVNSGNVGIYVDGVLKTTGTLVGNFYSQATSQKPLTVGAGSVSANDGGSIALFRISATAPSPEQIKKIYEDEKVLFQENAQATLYGSSDAVTALAYDDSTELLHVGTSAGRSVFQGLRRVDNTTTAVGTAISASNGLVADE